MSAQAAPGTYWWWCSAAQAESVKGDCKVIPVARSQHDKCCSLRLLLAALKLCCAHSLLCKPRDMHASSLHPKQNATVQLP